MTPHNNCPEPFILPGHAHLYAAGSFKLEHEGRRRRHAGQHLHARARRSRSAPSRWKARSTSSRVTMGIDPIELRLRNEPEHGSDDRRAAFSSRHLVEGLPRRRRALRLGAAR